MKTDKLFNVTYSLIIGLGLLFLGIIILMGRKWLYINVVNLFIIALFILSIRDILNYFKSTKRNKSIDFIRSITSMMFCLIFTFFKNIPLSILPIVFGFYLVLNASIKIINLVLLIENRAPGKLTESFLILLYLGVGISCIFAPLRNLEGILVIIGIYLILLGLNFIRDFLPVRFKDKVKRRIRVSMPTILEAIIPFTVLNEINYLLDKKSMDEEFVYEEKNGDVEPDIEVLVHISNRGWNRLGHCDIVYNGKVLSYGSYDKSTLKFFNTIADGVVFTADVKKYIPFCIKYSKKTLFSFGLKLSDKQKENVLKEIDTLFKNLTPWESAYQVALKESNEVNKEDYGDYASCLYMATNADMYKFTKGRYKKYFTLGNNCVKLADEIIGKSGIDAFKMYGIITPGAYYEYLNREFKKKNSMVISRKIYNDRSIKKRKRSKK